MHVAAAAGPCLVARGILQRRGSEDLAPALAAPQPVGVVERMACLVAQDAHEPPCVTAFRFSHDAALEALQPRMSQVERNGDAGDPIRREPLFRKPDVRMEANAPGLELRIELLDPALDARALEPQAEVAE